VSVGVVLRPQVRLVLGKVFGKLGPLAGRERVGQPDGGELGVGFNFLQHPLGGLLVPAERHLLPVHRAVPLGGLDGDPGAVF
jgi:hypothetical protein